MSKSKRKRQIERTNSGAVNGTSALAPKADEPKRESSWTKLFARINEFGQTYGDMPMNILYGAFGNAWWSNQPQIQNARVKAISTMPFDYSKDELGEFLRFPATSELPLRQIAQGLRYSNYPMFKLVKSYADILTYRHYSMSRYLTAETAKSAEYKRESILVDKINKRFRPQDVAHKAAGEAMLGKVFYILRHKIDKVHNDVSYVFAQQLPTDWCDIIGYNNISKYTISFNMMYFLQPGTDPTQFGDLFDPYMQDFLSVIETESKPSNSRFVYAEQNGKTYNLDKINKDGVGKPRMFMQNGRWMYYVSLPIDRVWTFEIDDISPINAPVLSGLLQTLNQQSDFEAAQFSLILLPLMKLFTGEVPYYDADGATTEDTYKMSKVGIDMFTAVFNNLMRAMNTGGVGFFGAPFQNIKSHDFSEVSSGNNVASAYNQYGMEKAGMTALIPVTENPHQGVAEYSAKLESRFADRIYSTMEMMMNNLYERLNLRFGWNFYMFGSIYRDDQIRADAQKALDKGDITAYYALAALDDMSINDKLSMAESVKASGWLDLLTIPPTAYTQSAKQTTTVSESAQGGRPTKTEVEVQDTVREKQAQGEETGRN